MNNAIYIWNIYAQIFARIELGISAGINWIIIQKDNIVYSIVIYCKLLQQQIKHWQLKLAKPAAAKSVYLSDTSFFKRCSKSFNLSAGVRASLSVTVCVCACVHVEGCACACFVGHVVFTIYAEKFALAVTDFPWMPNRCAAYCCLLSVCMSPSLCLSVRLNCC